MPVDFDDYIVGGSKLISLVGVRDLWVFQNRVDIAGLDVVGRGLTSPESHGRRHLFNDWHLKISIGAIILVLFFNDWLIARLFQPGAGAGCGCT